MVRHNRLQAEAVRHALSGRAEDLFRQAWGEPEKLGAANWRARTSSALSMAMRGPKRGLWRNHKNGEGGNLLDFYAVHVLGLPNARADLPCVVATAGAWCGLRPEEPQDLSVLHTRREVREARAAAEARAEAQRKAVLVAELVRRAQPVHSSPAATYLANRGVTRFAVGELAYVPACPDLKGLGDGRCYGALVVWAKDEAGTIIGEQRILVLPDGSPAPEKNRKPSFGRVSSFPARFPGTNPAALLVAEGPETALSIWLATGLETWAVFGAGFFLSAPLPTNRKVILAPDRDAPGSPAARSYGTAVTHHLAHGVDLWQADAPEPKGSKRDLNDTLRRAGEEAVREAIFAARSLRPLPIPPVHPGPDRGASREAGIAKAHGVIRRWSTKSEPMTRATREMGQEVAARAPGTRDPKTETRKIAHELRRLHDLPRAPRTA